VPNYNLQRAHDENAVFHSAPTVSLAQSVRLLRLALWDEQHRRMIRFGDLRTLQRA
jgi:omega-6 fatty acid desaturase (delta-12 desaturase)